MEHQFNTSIQSGRPYIRDASSLLQSYRDDHAAHPLYGDHRDDIPRTTRVTYATNADLRRRRKTDHETADDLFDAVKHVEVSAMNQRQLPIRTANIHEDMLDHAISAQEMRNERPATMPLSEWFYMQSKKY